METARNHRKRNPPNRVFAWRQQSLGFVKGIIPTMLFVFSVTYRYHWPIDTSIPTSSTKINTNKSRKLTRTSWLVVACESRTPFWRDEKSQPGETEVHVSGSSSAVPAYGFGSYTIVKDWLRLILSQTSHRNSLMVVMKYPSQEMPQEAGTYFEADRFSPENSSAQPSTSKRMPANPTRLARMLNASLPLPALSQSVARPCCSPRAYVFPSRQSRQRHLACRAMSGP